MSRTLDILSESLSSLARSLYPGGYGLTLGWDIRPNRLQAIILRTSLRWYPDLTIDAIDRKEISFANLEFNFIQVIAYLNRF